MYIKSVDIQNFRKLASIRVDLSESTTLLVGANNSGKTSALVALQRFLVDGAGAFRVTDITISNWKDINDVGMAWESQEVSDAHLSPAILNQLMPSLDLWIGVNDNEIHRVSSLIPSLKWKGGLLGVRVAMEVKNIELLYREYRSEKERNTRVASSATLGNGKEVLTKAKLWPTSLTEFLTRRLNKHFEFNYYVLDSAQRGHTVDSDSPPQKLQERAVKLAENPIKALIKINQISAQRGFSDTSNASSDDDDITRTDKNRLSRQLSAYYTTHLDPSDMPDEKDLEALDIIAEAQDQFDQRLRGAFAEALSEMEDLGYPGISDPRIRVASRLNAEQSLSHESAVSFLIDVDGDSSVELHLPEAHNGLGYQNLISMVFQLMSFRDKWMRVGKEGLRDHDKDIAPIHLVLVEEPEAHLHVQVQQVFARKAYEVLRNSSDLENNEHLSTQLVMSTHSSHISHELAFSQLRYFRRLPAGSERSVPTTSVVSLRDVFGDEDKTNSFVSRYLRAHHADLFFADAVLMVEGSAERMLLPNFIRTLPELKLLNSAYITMLEINGSHSHRLKDLIETLRIPTLVITDIDAARDRTAVPVVIGQGQVSSNPALKTWAKLDAEIDTLLVVSPTEKILELGDPLFQVRFAYQTQVNMRSNDVGETVGVYPSTFEDALALENPRFFASLEGSGLTAKFRAAFEAHEPGDSLAAALFEALKNGKKAEFVLDILASDKFGELGIPGYIYDGLIWLQEKLDKQAKNASSSVDAALREAVDG